MPIEKPNPITGHALTLIPPTAAAIRLDSFGERNTDAGYVYLIVIV